MQEINELNALSRKDKVIPDLELLPGLGKVVRELGIRGDVAEPGGGC